MVFNNIPVSERGVLPIEIHGIGDDKTSVVEDNNVKEIIELLQDAVRKHVSSARKNIDQSKQEVKSGILTGSHVRVGYVFKKKPGNQICLIPGADVAEPSIEKEDDYLRSFQVLQEKVIVYAHLLCPGSPNKMSQLMKHVGDKRQSMGTGVSISSYFQRMSTHLSSISQARSRSTSGCHEETLQTNNQSAGNAQVAPPSEGRRHKIKSIVSRADENASKRRHRNTVKNREPKQIVKSSMTSSVFELGSDISGDEESSDTKPFKQISANTQLSKLNFASDDCYYEKKIIHKKPIMCLEDKKENEMNFARMKINESNAQTSASYETISDTDVVQSNSKGNQVNDKSEVDGMQGMMKDLVCSKLKVSEVASNESNSVKAQYSGVQATVEKTSNRDLSINSVVEDTSNNCVIGGMKITQVSVSGLHMIPADVTDPDSVTLIGVEQMREIQDSTSVSSDSQTDESVLPTASFCTRSYDSSSPKQNSDQGMQRKSSDVKSVNALLKFPFNRSREIACGSDFKGIQSSSDRIQVSQGSENLEQTSSMSSDLRNNLRHFNFKRKLPNFSDTDSDDMLPVAKASKGHTCSSIKKRTQKFVKQEASNRKSKRYTFPNFLSESNTKKQTKLSFFLNKENVETSGDTEDKDDMDITDGLIEELSQTSRIKQELDSSLKQEVAKLRSVKELNEEHLRFLTNENEKHLRKIFEGKLKCPRHDQYNQGGRSRRNLNYESGLGEFSDEQVDVVMETLMAMFCKRHHKYLDYLMKVLLPEMLIKLHKDVHGTSNKESETTLGQQTLTLP